MSNIDFFIKILEIISYVISVISVVVVIYGTAIATAKFLRNELRRFKCKNITHQIRVLRADLGTYLLLGLEFLIASDILKTIIEPGLHELLLLGGIVLLRTILSFFLDREIRLIEMESRRNPERTSC